MAIRLEGFKHITYLIGAMETTAEGDDGGKKREDVEKELLRRKVFPINPVTLERFKVDHKTSKVKDLMEKWIEENNWSKYTEFSRLIWKGKDFYNKKEGLVHIPGDFDYVRMSDWITCLYNEGDSPCGTFGEAFLAFELDIPVYLVTKVPIAKLKRSFLQAIYGSGGMVFGSFGEYFNFIETRYKVYPEEEKK